MSPFYVGEFRGYSSVADGEDVDTAEVPGLAVAHLAIHPEHYGAIAAYDDFLGFELCVSIVREPSAPEFEHGGFARDAAAVGGGGGIFEDGVVRQERR